MHQAIKIFSSAITGMAMILLGSVLTVHAYQTDSAAFQQFNRIDPQVTMWGVLFLLLVLVASAVLDYLGFKFFSGDLP